MKKKSLNNQKGFAATDALIAVLIISLFTGLIGTVLYNIYLSNSSIKRMAQATAYITDIFEYTDKIYYEEVTSQSIVNDFNDKAIINEEDAYAIITDSSTVEYNNANYRVDINVKKYNETSGNEDKLDLIKTVTVKVLYNIGSKEQTIEMKKIKKRENLITPNSPNLSLIPIDSQNNEKVFPIKNINNKWQVTNENSDTWYNYDNGYWAIALKTTENLEVGQEIDITGQESNIYAWIPRYAYNLSNTTDIKFMYSTSNNCVISDLANPTLYKLEIINNNYCLNLFANTETGKWITWSQMEEQTVPTYFYYLNESIYEIKNLEITE